MLQSTEKNHPSVEQMMDTILRKHKQEAVSKVLGVSKKSIDNYKTGNSNPHKDILGKIVETYRKVSRGEDILEPEKPQLGATESEFFSAMVTDIAALKATVSVITPIVANLEALSRKESVAKIGLEFEEMIKRQTEQIVIQLQKRFS